MALLTSPWPSASLYKSLWWIPGFVCCCIWRRDGFIQGLDLTRSMCCWAGTETKQSVLWPERKHKGLATSYHYRSCKSFAGVNASGLLVPDGFQLHNCTLLPRSSLLLCWDAYSLLRCKIIVCKKQLPLPAPAVSPGILSHRACSLRSGVSASIYQAISGTQFLKGWRILSTHSTS